MPNKKIENMILDEVAKTIEIGNLAFINNRIKFENIEIRFTLRGVTAGRSHYINDRNMTLWFHIELAKRDWSEYKNTIKHEIAHLYQKKMYPRSKPHGYQFKMVARKLGDDGGRCHSMNTKGLKQERALKRFIYECPKCGREYKLTKGKHNKQIRYTMYSCGHCGFSLEFTSEVRDYSNITGKIMKTYYMYEELF